jgi:hypothetical protein
MQVAVELEVLVPGVQDGSEPGQRLEPWPALGQFEQRLGGGLEEKVVQAPRVS